MMEVRTKVPNEYHVWWDSLADMEATLPAMAMRANGGKWQQHMREHSRTRFDLGCGSVREALERVSSGWPELLVTLREMVESIKQRIDLAEVEAVTVSVRRRKRTRRDYGDTLDMTRVWNGQLDTAWERPTRRNVLVPTQRYATIFVDLAMMAYVSFEESLWRAAETYCIYEVLTRMGISTEIWCGSSHDRQFDHDWGAKAWKAVRIKEYTQPLTDEKLVVMTSSAFHRTYGWYACFAAPESVRNLIGSPLHEGLVKPLRERAEAGERVFRVGQHFSEEAAVNDMKKVVAILATQYGGSREVA